MATSRCTRQNRTPIARDLSAVLRRHREALNLSQEAFADKVGLSANYIGNIERGEYEISLSALHRVVGALGRSLSEILKEAGY